MSRQIITVLLCTLMVYVPKVYGHETSNIECSARELSDVKDDLNKETNRRISAALASLKDCSARKLNRALQRAIANGWVNNLATWIVEGNLPKCQVKFEESVYRDFKTPANTIAMKVFGLYPVVNVNGTYLGADKIAHFMTEGYEYYELSKKGALLTRLLKKGEDEEAGKYGKLTTGVYSYADLAANYRGFEFWRDLFEGSDPRIKCDAGRWKLVREFKWEEYVDASFDETINCNEYSTFSRLKSVEKHSVAIRTKEGKTPLVCPFAKSSCESLVQKYKTSGALNSIISPSCRDVVAN